MMISYVVKVFSFREGRYIYIHVRMLKDYHVHMLKDYGDFRLLIVFFLSY